MGHAIAIVLTPRGGAHTQSARAALEIARKMRGVRWSVLVANKQGAKSSAAC